MRFVYQLTMLAVAAVNIIASWFNYKDGAPFLLIASSCVVAGLLICAAIIDAINKARE
jgi:hypothetical protein